MNQNVLAELLERIPLAGLLAAFALYTAYDYHDFTSNPDSPLGSKRVRIATLTEENTGFQRQITDARNFFLTLNQKREELRSLAVQLDEMRTILTEDLDVPGLIKMVLTEAGRVGLVVQSIRPMPLNSTDYYDEQPFDLAFKGVYAQFLVFLERLASLERIVRVDEFEIKRAGMSGPYVELDGRVKVKAYRYKGSKADDLAREGGSVKPQGTGI